MSRDTREWIKEDEVRSQRFPRPAAAPPRGAAPAVQGVAVAGRLEEPVSEGACGALGAARHASLWARVGSVAVRAVVGLTN
ncbi:hypothetical protein E2C01_014320 [Portunus trituberculatus]|uniref:Uncharacterized protein n=1 Tax=Portunus trituberculatus TaxID=210409 RepID=A0A5B7DK49_PORTR|nr:hypothetical protein [Portunus trituberculatus]